MEKESFKGRDLCVNATIVDVEGECSPICKAVITAKYKNIIIEVPIVIDKLETATIFKKGDVISIKGEIRECIGHHLYVIHPKVHVQGGFYGNSSNFE